MDADVADAAGDRRQRQDQHRRLLEGSRHREFHKRLRQQAETGRGGDDEGDQKHAALCKLVERLGARARGEAPDGERERGC